MSSHSQETFAQGMVKAIAHRAHRRPYPRGFTALAKGDGGVLAALVGRMNHLLRKRWGPSPCDRLPRPRTTTTPPPPPLGTSWRRAFRPVRSKRTEAGSMGRFTRSLLYHSTGEVPNYAPAVSPRLRRRPSPWPPCRRHQPGREFPAPLWYRYAPQPSPDPSGSSWWVS